MTVEEKAVEIADNAKRQKYFDDRCNDLAGNIAYQSAHIMAKWKDAQFKEYLEKKYDTALNAWDDWAAYDPKTAESWRVKTQYIREIINEIFGGEQYDNL